MEGRLVEAWKAVVAGEVMVRRVAVVAASAHPQGLPVDSWVMASAVVEVTDVASWGEGYLGEAWPEAAVWAMAEVVLVVAVAMVLAYMAGMQEVVRGAVFLVAVVKVAMEEEVRALEMLAVVMVAAGMVAAVWVAGERVAVVMAVAVEARMEGA
jgi:hypothetical protein